MNRGWFLTGVPRDVVDGRVRRAPIAPPPPARAPTPAEQDPDGRGSWPIPLTPCGREKATA